MPSGTAAACELLLRLSGAYDRGDWNDIARATLQHYGAPMEQAPMAVPALLHAQLLADAGADLAIPAGPGSESLFAEARSTFAPLLTRLHAPPGALPIMQGRSAGFAYLCRHGRCELPASSVEALREQLAPRRDALRA